MERHLVATRPNRRVGRATQPHFGMISRAGNSPIVFDSRQLFVGQHVLHDQLRGLRDRRKSRGWPGQVGRVPEAQDASSWACGLRGTERRRGCVLSLCDPTDKSVGPPESITLQSGVAGGFELQQERHGVSLPNGGRSLLVCPGGAGVAFMN